MSAIALAHAFVDGNKRTFKRAVRLFLRLNGYMLERESQEFANAILALVNRTDSLESATDRFAAWVRTRMRPQAPEHG